MRLTLTYHDERIEAPVFSDRVARSTQALQASGVGDDDVVALLMRNHPLVVELMPAARTLGVSIMPEESPHPDDFERAFSSIQRQRPDALIVIENPVFYTNRFRLVALAAGLRIPNCWTISPRASLWHSLCRNRRAAEAPPQRACKPRSTRRPRPSRSGARRSRPSP